jgi:hypothetical protein
LYDSISAAAANDTLETPFDLAAAIELGEASNQFAYIVQDSGLGGSSALIFQDTGAHKAAIFSAKDNSVTMIHQTGTGASFAAIIQK